MGGEVEYFHSFVCASLVATGQSRALPLAPEFVRPRDGTGKRDCGSRAARRRAGTGRAFHGRTATSPFGRRPPLPPAALRSGPSCGRQPHPRVQAVGPQDVGRIPAGHGVRRGGRRCRPGFGHTSPPVPTDGRLAPVRRRRCAPHHPAGGRDRQARRQDDLPQRLHHRPRRHARQCRRNRRLRTRTVEDRERDLQRSKDQRLQPGHNFGHGRGGPANLPVVPDLLAFAAHTACDLGAAARQRARRTLGTRRRLFDHVRTITAHVVFPSWTGPVATPVTGVPPPAAARTPPHHPPQTPTEPSNENTNPIMGIAGPGRDAPAGELGERMSSRSGLPPCVTKGGGPRSRGSARCPTTAHGHRT